MIEVNIRFPVRMTTGEELWISVGAGSLSDLGLMRSFPPVGIKTI